MKNEALTNYLHDAFLRCGEILPPADIARKTRELEFDFEVEFDAQTVLASVREAGERFVDSMVQNEHDTEEAVIDGLYCGFPIDTLEARVAKWENMRPSGNTMNHTPHNMSNPQNTLRKGDLVMVFCDPVTCKEFEGNASLKKHLRANGDGSEYWQVTFEEDGFTCCRTVWPKHAI